MTDSWERGIRDASARSPLQAGEHRGPGGNQGERRDRHISVGISHPSNDPGRHRVLRSSPRTTRRPAGGSRGSGSRTRTGSCRAGRRGRAMGTRRGPSRRRRPAWGLPWPPSSRWSTGRPPIRRDRLGAGGRGCGRSDRRPDAEAEGPAREGLAVADEGPAPWPVVGPSDPCRADGCGLAASCRGERPGCATITVVLDRRGGDGRAYDPGTTGERRLGADGS